MVLDRGDETVIVPRGTGMLQQGQSVTAVRTRLTLCIFLYTIGASMMSQVYPKIILITYEGDDGEASKYRGWMAAAVSVVQLIFIPALSTSSDVFGRKALICFALGLHAMCVFTLATKVRSMAWSTACRLVTSLGSVVSPVSQAIMIDLSPEGGKAATYGLGIAFGVFALGNSAGDIVGGLLSEHHRGVACLVSGALATAGLLPVVIFGWKETAPSFAEGGRRQRSWCCWLPWWRMKKPGDEEGGGLERGDAGVVVTDLGGGNMAGHGLNVVTENVASAGGTAGDNSGGITATVDEDGVILEDGRPTGRRGTATRGDMYKFNSFSVLNVFLESRILLRIAFSYFAFILSLNVFATGYNYVDYRFHWTPPEISYFFATYNILMAIAGGWVIRFIVPARLSEENGGLFGIFVQACATTVSGLCFRGWMLYPALAFGALQNITEPCLQAVMAPFVGADKQGSLQGAVMSLRVVGEGVAAAVFTQVFSAGTSAGFEQAPFFLATLISLIGLAVAWSPLRKLDKQKKKAFEDHMAAPPVAAPAAGDRLECAAEKGCSAIGDATAVSRTTPAPARGQGNEGQTCCENDPDRDVLPRGGTAQVLTESGDVAVMPEVGLSERGGDKPDKWKEGVNGEDAGEEELRRPLLQHSPGPAWD